MIKVVMQEAYYIGFVDSCSVYMLHRIKFNKDKHTAFITYGNNVYKRVKLSDINVYKNNKKINLRRWNNE